MDNLYRETSLSYTSENGIFIRGYDLGEIIGRIPFPSTVYRVSVKTLPSNVDGAIAATLCEIDFPVRLANAVFMVSRMTGILIHTEEEQEQMPPMRRIDLVNHVYCGPTSRNLLPSNEGMPRD